MHKLCMGKHTYIITQQNEGGCNPLHLNSSYATMVSNINDILCTGLLSIGFNIPAGIGLAQLLVAVIISVDIFHPPEPENNVTIYAMQSSVFAGSSYTLNCTVVSDLRPVVKWTGPDSNPVHNTSSITVDAPVYDGIKTYLLLRFPALRTSQVGRYTCQSLMSSPLSVRTATKDVAVRGR